MSSVRAQVNTHIHPHMHPAVLKESCITPHLILYLSFFSFPDLLVDVAGYVTIFAL